MTRSPTDGRLESTKAQRNWEGFRRSEDQGQAVSGDYFQDCMRLLMFIKTYASSASDRGQFTTVSLHRHRQGRMTKQGRAIQYGSLVSGIWIQRFTYSARPSSKLQSKAAGPIPFSKGQGQSQNLMAKGQLTTQSQLIY